MDRMNISLAHKFARLFTYAKDPLISVQEVLGKSEFTDLFNFPLSAQAYEELMELNLILQNHTSELVSDCWTWRQNTKEPYTANKFYTMVHALIQSTLCSIGFGNPTTYSKLRCLTG